MITGASSYREREGGALSNDYRGILIQREREKGVGGGVKLAMITGASSYRGGGGR